MQRSTFLRAAIGALALPLCAANAFAADYPTRPIELLVPYAVGGGTDAVARAFADTAGRQLSQGMVVVNRPGAAGAIGHQEGAKAPADGYKLTMVTPEINLAYLQGIGKARPQDFTFIARLNIDPIVLIVPANSPFKTLEEVLAKAKSKPGEVALANSGKGATYHLAAVALEEKTGLAFNNIPYIGAGPEMTAILGNQVEGGFATTGEAGNYVKAGKFRLLGVMAAERLKDFPDVPTFKERGIDLQLGTWRALAVPKGTPPTVIAKLKEVAHKVSQEPKYQQFFSNQFLGMVYEDGDRLAPELDREFKFYSDIVSKLQLK
ncbi:tripartite tricarboxylate transporter substrate binding protein [Variovorax sp. KK3]|uniref:Bug family tripartite tricarboxylate transporter substrate binding protein n=1 Tax=Variovorax sp. KK3 TaxID=1855728 RepID=UPI00097C62D7|nr:tripartite tricarboxylate transporter substrate binding protein [Variovorax sp. KK3]